jgi:hypothetical protein
MLMGLVLLKYLNTGNKGEVTKIDFNDYTYNNIVLNGNLRLPNTRSDFRKWPNLNMNFDGLDLSNKDNKYDFHINVENADYRLKLVKILSIF